MERKRRGVASPVSALSCFFSRLLSCCSVDGNSKEGSQIDGPLLLGYLFFRSSLRGSEPFTHTHPDRERMRRRREEERQAVPTIVDVL